MLASGWRDLFDGKTLSGWKIHSGRIDSWRVEGSSLVTSGSPRGWLFTEEEYSDFELRLEYKVSTNANSGISIRNPAPNVASGWNDPSHKGLEIQIVDDENPAAASWGGFPTGSIFGVVTPSRRVTRATGEWNTMDIVVRGRQVVVSINDSLVVNANLDNYPGKVGQFPGLQRTSGFIGLQLYANQVEFRDIRIQRIEP